MSQQNEITSKVFIKPSQETKQGVFVDIKKAEQDAKASCIPGHCNGKCQGGV